MVPRRRQVRREGRQRLSRARRGGEEGTEEKGAGVGFPSGGGQVAMRAVRHP